jgi:hydrogenase expression/formation protein HypD
VYSPLDAVTLAADNPDKQVVFFGVGFETTTPAVALSILEARRTGLTSFRVLCAHKLIPPAMMALAADPEIAIDGFICPGHVSAIIGSEGYEPVARERGIPCVIAGFEPLDILQGILMLVRQVAEARSEVEIAYSRAVSKVGNPAARACVASVFEPSDSEWRGLGVIPMSGLKLRPEFAEFDASPLAGDAPVAAEAGACECGSILKGLKSPADCPAFGAACTPEHPLGPCMVSSEGSCAAEYRYSRITERR